MSENSPIEKPLLKIALPSSSLRNELGKFLEPEFIDDMGLRAFDMYVNAGGFEIVAPGDTQRPEFRCAQFVFATTNKEPWADEDKYIPIFRDPLKFFLEKGYKPLYEGDQPRVKDIVAYGFLQQNPAPFRLVHMGIHEGPLVRSKINEGHVVRHPLGGVPFHFGTHAFYFRK